MLFYVENFMNFGMEIVLITDLLENLYLFS